jgi:predicted esterase
MKARIIMRKLFIAVACILYSFIGASAQDWRAQFGTLVNTPPGPEMDSLFRGIISAKPDWREVMTEIESLTFPDTTGGRALLGSTSCNDGVDRPYVIYVPSSYDPRIPTPMLVHLHGVVMRPNINSNPEEYIGNTAIMAEAEKMSWFVLFPFGQKGASWFDEVGMANIMSLVRTAKVNFNIDDDRVYLSGLSDGASAAFLFAMVMPTDFAAYAALNGTMSTGSDEGGFSTYAPNMANTHIYVTTADCDRYFPTDQMERTIAMAEKAGANILYRKLKGEHIPSIIDFEYADMFDYLEQHPRNATPDTIVWETAVAEFGVCNWLAIDEVTIDEPAPWHIDYNVALVDSTVSIGFVQANAYPGPGVKVGALADGDYLARRIGLQLGDIIINGNGIAIENMADLNKFKATLQRGSEVTLTVMRGENEIALQGWMPPPENYLVFKRDKPSALARAVYTDNQFDIKGSCVGRFHILINPKMVDLDKNVVVIFNGQKIFDDKIAPDIGYMLRDFLVNGDRKLISVNEVSFRPTK